ncbi:PREDICTED: ectonucleotide pyrophosphatase/phosphodiesterase family member 7 [Lipotes vexillifer]|uniref:Ectonucleotide pyrophosphatase/phosphodiesterase family member 7 n=1 Tax=Lipotes vexillifer TaxID=118797 RepID=A0A340XM30_LIPVE|nr:PREDICTED: ectonucleotide pyrophosphatase/phosphodiesterase family member 7 [Lipotes vexillifer]
MSGEPIMGGPAVLLAVALATLLVPASGAPIRRQGSRNKLLLVTFDGFRWNYDQDVHTPNLDAMALDGVKARYMTPAFVTLTSPCHFTLVTGKYIEHHGVVHNMFYNTSSKVKLPYHATLGVQRWWDNGSLPIWITAQRQGLKTGSFLYPGGNVTYQGEAVTLSRKEGILHNYKDEMEWRANIDTVMTWFTDEGLDLVTLYFGEPDSTGHKYGPESQQRKDMVRQVDRTVGYLRESIRKSSLEGSLNLIIVSDHGMSTVNKNASDLVELHKIANFTFKDIEFELLDYGPNGMLLPKEGKLEKVYEVLKDAHPRLHVYKKELFPKSFHYASHPRVTPLLMYSDLGYVIHGRLNVQFNNGEHGFDNNIMDMKTIFRAVGPSFKRGLEVEPFESIHVYELMCRLLGIVPEANDGLLSTLLPTLQEAGDGVLSTSSAPRLTTTSSELSHGGATICGHGGGGVSGACSGSCRRPDGGRAIGPNPQMLGPQPPPPMGGEEALPGAPSPKSTCLQPGAISIRADQVLHPGHQEVRLPETKGDQVQKCGGRLGPPRPKQRPSGTEAGSGRLAASQLPPASGQNNGFLPGKRSSEEARLTPETKRDSTVDRQVRRGKAPPSSPRGTRPRSPDPRALPAAPTHPDQARRTPARGAKLVPP